MVNERERLCVKVAAVVGAAISHMVAERSLCCYDLGHLPSSQHEGLLAMHSFCTSFSIRTEPSRQRALSR